MMLTTIDNPYNPFDKWDEWYAYDIKRYDTCGYLARIASSITDEMSDKEIKEQTTNAMNEIVEANQGLYITVTKESYNKTA